MGALRDTWHCTMEKQMAMFLTTVGHHRKTMTLIFISQGLVKLLVDTSIMCYMQSNYLAVGNMLLGRL